jgi:hypothetical protein
VGHITSCRNVRNVALFCVAHSGVPVTQSDSLVAMFLPRRDSQIVPGSELADVHGQKELASTIGRAHSLRSCCSQPITRGSAVAVARMCAYM